MTAEGYTYGHWKLNETTGFNVPDTSGNSRNGTMVNMNNNDWITGKLNNCLTFDGNNDYVTFGAIAGFERTNKFSIEFWFNTTDGGSGKYFLSKQLDNGSTNRGWSVWLDAGKIVADLINNEGDVTPNLIRKTTTTATYDDGAWHHVCVTYDGSSTAAGLIIYLDGAPAGTTTNHDNLTDTIANAANMEMASRDVGGYYGGEIDEVVIYDYERSSGQIIGRYNAGTGREDFPTDIKSNYYIAAGLASDYYILSTFTKLLNSDSYILTTFTKTLDSDIYIYVTATETLDSDFYILATSTEILDSDSYILDTIAEILASDSHVLASSTETLESNTYTLVTNSSTNDSDFYIFTTIDQTLNSEAIVIATLAKTINSNAFIIDEFSELMLSDSMILATVEQTLDSDIYHLVTVSETLSSDSCINRPISKTLDSNACILIPSYEKTIGSDSYILETFENTVDSDYYPLVTLSSTVDSDAYPLVTIAKTLNSSYYVELHKKIPHGYQTSTWEDGSGRTWRSYYDYDNSRVVFEYTSNNGATWTENENARISANAYTTAWNARTLKWADFSVVHCEGYLYIAYVDNYDIKIRAVTGTYPGYEWSWSSAVTIFDGSVDNGYYISPVIAMRPSGKLIAVAVLYQYDGSFTITPRVTLGTVVQSIGNWTAPANLNSSTSSHGTYVSVRPGSSGDAAYAVWNEGTSLMGKYYSGSSWGSVESIATLYSAITTCYKTGWAMEAASDSNKTLGIVYPNASAQTGFIHNSDPAVSDNWETPVTVSSNSSTYPTIAEGGITPGLFNVGSIVGDYPTKTIYVYQGSSPYSSWVERYTYTDNPTVLQITNAANAGESITFQALGVVTTFFFEINNQLSGDSWVLKETSQTRNSDYSIKKLAQEATISQEAFIYVEGDNSLSGSWHIKSTVSKTLNQDAYTLKAANIVTLDSDSYVLKETATTLNSDYDVYVTDTNNLYSSYCIKTLANTETLDSDSFMLKLNTETLDSDYSILPTIEETLGSDYYILKLYSKSLISNYYAHATLAKTLGSASFVLEVNTETIDGGAMMLASIGATIDSDLYPLVTQSSTIDSDAYPRITQTITLESNAVITYIYGEETIDSDSYILATISGTINSNCYVLTPISQTINSNLYIEDADVTTAINSDAWISNAGEWSEEWEVDVYTLQAKTLESLTYVKKLNNNKTLTSRAFVKNLAVTKTIYSNYFIGITGGDDNSIACDYEIRSPDYKPEIINVYNASVPTIIAVGTDEPEIIRVYSGSERDIPTD